MQYPLFDQMHEYGLDSLIPNLADLDYEEIMNCSGYSQCRDDRVYSYDDFNYYDEEEWNDEEDLEYNEDDDEWEGNIVTSTDVYYSVDDFQSKFEDYCYIDQEDFLKLNLWELIGVTKKQMDLVPWQQLHDYNFFDFCDAFRSDHRSISLDKKLLYAGFDSQLSYRKLTIRVNGCPNHEDIQQYCERIIDKHGFDEASHLIQMLIDYYRFYPDAITMNERRAEEGQPVFKYEFFPKPAHLKDLHDKAFRDHVAMETERMTANKDNLSQRILAVSETPDYKNFLFEDENFTVLPVKSQEDLTEEGAALQHCVASYGSYMASGSSYIFRIRETNDLDTALYTAEIIPEDIRQHVRAQLKQCYGYKDTTIKTDKFRTFITQWANKKNFRIVCVV